MVSYTTDGNRSYDGVPSAAALRAFIAPADSIIASSALITIIIRQTTR